mmetsp:Transcript_72552/g.115768  ORF Transcript_72552/g.115768 Transcript_72552/m.115768 type:complete len:669 (+) Transcript_72552:25-2031(+)
MSSMWQCATCSLANSTDRRFCQACFTESDSWKAHRLRDKSDEILLLLHGYIREVQMNESSIAVIPDAIRETIRLYSWFIPPYSLQCIAATYKLAHEINEYMNSAENKCEFSGNLDLNILEYIFVRGGALRDMVLLRKMKDVDLVINIHELNLKYLQHLQTYHASKEQQDESKVKCVFWRHYLNKFKTDGEKNNDFNDYARNFRKSPPDYNSDNEKADKIMQFEHYIEDADYVLNARFVINVIYNRHERRNDFRFQNISQPYFHHWLCVLRGSYHDTVNQTFEMKNISFDIVNQTQNTYGRYMTYKEKLHFQGLSNMEQILQTIDIYHRHLERVRKLKDIRELTQPQYPKYGRRNYQSYNNAEQVESHQERRGYPSRPLDDAEQRQQQQQHPDYAMYDTPQQQQEYGSPPIQQPPQPPPVSLEQAKELEALKEIMVPIFPFAMHVHFYDFTINSMHIDLLHVLQTRENQMIDGINYHWDKLIGGKQYNCDVINQYNAIGLNDLRRKTIVAPTLEVLSKATADFYFWRLVKCAANFIDKIEEGVWKIDETYLQRTISLYPKWFGENWGQPYISEKYAKVMEQFVPKFVKWGISETTEQETRRDIVNRFRVFRYIKFEPHFVRALNAKVNRLGHDMKNALKLNLRRIRNQGVRRFYTECFEAFGYPSISIK